MIRQFLLSFFRRRRPVVIVPHYRVQRTDLQLRRDLKHAELAKSLGRTWKDR